MIEKRSMNLVILIGNVGKAPTLDHVGANSTPVSKFPLVTTTIDKNRVEHAEWHNIVLWGKAAEFASQYVTVGSLVKIDGRLQTRHWDDKDTGKKVYMTEVVGNVTILHSKKQDGAGQPQGGAGQPQQQQQQAPPQQPNQGDAFNQGGGGDDEPLPF